MSGTIDSFPPRPEPVPQPDGSGVSPVPVGGTIAGHQSPSGAPNPGAANPLPNTSPLPPWPDRLVGSRHEP